MAAKAPVEIDPTVRTSAGLRNVLFDELDLVRNDKSNPTRVASISKLTTQIISSVKMEIDFHKEVRIAATTTGAPGDTTIQLGGPAMEPR